MKLSKVNPEFELRKLDDAKKSKKSVKASSYDIKYIVIDCCCMNYIDSMGMNTILNVRFISLVYF